MGNLLLESTLKKFNVYHSYSAWHEWQLLSQQNLPYVGRVVRNKRNPQLVGQLRVCKEINSLEKALGISQFRFSFINAPIVGIYGIYSMSQTPQINLCGGVQSYTVITQRIKYCFGDMGQIKFDKAIDIMKMALSGAKIISKHLNILPIYDQNTIFFDKDNKCKVWINSDINAQFSPYQNLPIKESDSVSSIFLTIEQKTQFSQEFQEFLQQKSTILISTFQEALKFVNQFFNHQVLRFSQHHQKEQISYQELNDNTQPIRKVINQQVNNKGLCRDCPKRSLSVKKVKKTSEACIFFSARKSNNRHSENYQNFKHSGKQVINSQLNFNQFLNHQKMVHPFMHENGLQRNPGCNLQVKTQNQFYEQKRGNELKKRIKNKNEIKQKFINFRIKENQINTKPSSALSTQYDQTDASSNFPSRMQPSMSSQALQPINFSKKRINRLKSPSNKNNLWDIFTNLKALPSDQSGNSSFTRLESCYSGRQEDNIEKSDKKQTSDKNIQNFPIKKAIIASCSPKLNKMSSMPNFHRISSMLSA